MNTKDLLVRYDKDFRLISYPEERNGNFTGDVITDHPPGTWHEGGGDSPLRIVKMCSIFVDREAYYLLHRCSSHVPGRVYDSCCCLP